MKKKKKQKRRQMDIRKYATKITRVRSYYGFFPGLLPPRRFFWNADIRHYFPPCRPVQRRAPPPPRRIQRIGPDTLIDWRDIDAAIQDEDSDAESVKTVLLEAVFNHNRKVIDNRRVRDNV